MAIWGWKSVFVLVMARLSMSLVLEADETVSKIDRTNKSLMNDVRYWCDNKCLIEKDVNFCQVLNNNLQKYNVNWKDITIDDCKASNASEQNFISSITTATTTTAHPSTSQDTFINIETTSAPAANEPTVAQPSNNKTEDATGSISDQPNTVVPMATAVSKVGVTYLAWVIPLITLILMGIAAGGIYINRYVKKTGCKLSTIPLQTPLNMRKEFERNRSNVTLCRAGVSSR